MTDTTRAQSMAELRTQGYEWDEVAQLVAAGSLVRVRRGVYAGTLSADPVARHRQLIRATLPGLSDRAVISHASAAASHGLPVWDDLLDRVHVTRDRPGGGTRGTVVHTHGGRLREDEVITVDGLTVTSVARTVLDCGCFLPHLRAVAIGDAALRTGLGREELVAAAAYAGRRVGAARMRRVVAFVDGGSESVGESFSRVILSNAGVAAPVLQLEITHQGSLVARSDFAWPTMGTLGEFDGRVKYGRLLRPGQDAGDAVFREKLREDRLRDLGWQVVRWTWDDVRQPGDVLDRLERAFLRGRPFPQA